MKRTQWTDALRNIWKQKVSWISILVIAMLAVAAYLGIHFAARAITDNGNAYYEETAFRDIEVLSTKLLSEDDLTAIRAVEGVADAEGVWQTAGELVFGGESASVNVVSLTRRVNIPKLLEGRLPEKADECALEQTVAQALQVKPGDTVSVQSPKGERAPYLGSGTFTVTGVVFHPDHGCLTLMVPGSREVVVLPEAFELDGELQGCCMKAELLLDKAAGTDRFGKAYFASVEAVKAGLDALSSERASLRDAEIRGLYQGEIDAGQEALDDAAAALRDARAELDDGAALLEEKQAELDDAERTLADTQRELEDGRIELEEAKETLDETQLQLADAERQLAAGKAELEASAQRLSDARAQLDDAKKQLDEGKTELDAGEEELAAAETEMKNGAQELADAEREIFEGEQELADARAELDAGAAELAAGQAQLDAAAAELNAGWLEIEDRKQEFRDVVKSGLKYVIDNFVHPLTPQESAAIDAIQWTAKGGAPNLNNAALDATWFQLTDSVGFQLSTVDYPSAAAAAMEQFDPLFDLALAEMQAKGIDTSDVAANKAVIQMQLQTYLFLAAVMEDAYNESVAQLQTWNDGHAAYLAGSAALAAGEAAYSDGLAKYNEGAAKLEEAKTQYASGLEAYEAGKRLFEEKSAEYAEGKQDYEAGLADYEAGEAEYEDGLRRYSDGLAQYQTKLAEYERGKSLYAQGLADYQDGQKRYEDGLRQYEEGRQRFEDGKRQLAEGRETLAEKEQEYADGLRRYEEGNDELAQARGTLGGLDPTRWVILDAQGNPSFAVIRNGSRNVSSMGVTFALVFVLVGALVIYATVGRIVDEQRRQVGATKALGLFNREILMKYLCFGVTAAVLGVAAGAAFGYFGIQRIVLHVYGRYYVFGAEKSAFLPGMTLLALLLAAALTGFTVWRACTDLLRSTAIRLMQEKAPPSKYRSRGKSVLPLYWRLVLLNMRTDKKRVAVTIVSVAGCCTLLVAGFSMRSSVMKSLDRQYTDVSVYEAKIRWEEETDPDSGAKIEEALRSVGADWIGLYDGDAVYSVRGELHSGELLCAPLRELDGFFRRSEPGRGKPLGDEPGVWISRAVSAAFGLHPGDEIVFYDDAMNPYPARVAGVFNMYVGREMILSAEGYAAVFGAAPENNAFLLRFGGADAGALRARLEGIPGFSELEEVAQLRATYQSYASVLNLIAGVLTAIAGVMAYFILLNLASMYINQKKRELTIMRVNGFTVGEVVRYVAGESVATTVLGIALGLVLGTLLSDRVLALIEDDTLRLLHGVRWSGWLLGALITVVFSAVIYALALRKVKDLKLTDVA